MTDDDHSPAEDQTINDDQEWIRLELSTDQPDFDGASLMKVGALGIEVRDATTFMEDAFAAVDDGRARLIAYFDADAPTAEVRRRVEQALDDVEVISVASYTDRSWETSWMRYFQATHLSPRVAVGPPWDEPADGSAQVILVIEPGMAFGTGTHETTRLSAQLIDELLATGQASQMLDVGCGSAILSMAAAGLGVPRVVGIDVDATAVEVARKNIEKNHFTDAQIALSTTALADLDDSFELVVANILATILLELREDLWRVVAPGGHLVLSGIGESQVEQMITAFSHPHFELVQTNQDGEWIALHFKRRGDA